jgi:hypothetical protein
VGILTRSGHPVAPTRVLDLPRIVLSHEHRAFVAILVLAALLRGVWSLFAAPSPESDFLTFLDTARAIAAGLGDPQSYGWSWQGPGYPILLAPLTFLGPASLPAIYAANTALGLLTIWLLYRIGTNLFGVHVGLVAAAIGAVYPGLWMWTPLVSAENLSIPILLAIAYLLISGAPSWRLPVLGVLTCGLVFVRPTMVFYVLIVGFTVIALAPTGRKALAAALFGASYVVSILVSVTAVQSVGGSGLPLGGSGWQAWLVHNERATGAWFPAQDRDDYPFHGMGDRSDLSETVRTAQVKLALQFALLNPGEILPGVLERHAGNWARDDAAVDWTLRRPTAGPTAADASGLLGVVAAASFSGLLFLALFGLWMRGDRLIVTLILVLPIAYVAAPTVVAEANARYHTNAMPFVAVLAAAGLVSSSKRQRLIALAGASLAALQGGPPSFLTPMLVGGILGVGAARLLLEGVRAARHQIRAGHGRRIAWRLATCIIAAELALTLAFGQSRQLVIDWSLVQPTRWNVYEGAEATNGTAPAVLPADLPPSVERVSFQDAAVLPGPARDVSRIGLARTFPDLDVGKRYVIYLQLQHPADRVVDDVTVLANGDPIWRLPEGVAQNSGWHDVIVPWQADTPFLLLQVERVARAPAGSPLLVRNVHLYPRY